MTQTLTRTPAKKKPTLSEDWVDDALCASIGSDIFFPLATRRESDYDEPKSICQKCPVIDQCLESTMEVEKSLSHHGRFGVFGGMTPKERAALQRQRDRFKTR